MNLQEWQLIVFQAVNNLYNRLKANFDKKEGKLYEIAFSKVIPNKNDVVITMIFYNGYGYIPIKLTIYESFITRGEFYDSKPNVREVEEKIFGIMKFTSVFGMNPIGLKSMSFDLNIVYNPHYDLEYLEYLIKKEIKS